MANVNQALLPPPKLTGDPQTDYAGLINYLWSFYRIVYSNYALRTPMLDVLASIPIPPLTIPDPIPNNAVGIFPYVTNDANRNTGSTTYITDFGKLLMQIGSASAAKSLLNAADSEVRYQFNLTLTGCTTSPTVACIALRQGGQVTLLFGNTIVATSNATTKTFTGLPAELWPVSATVICMNSLVCGDNSGPYTDGILKIGTNGVITLHPTRPDTVLWTASGTCFVYSDCLTYLL